MAAHQILNKPKTVRGYMLRKVKKDKTVGQASTELMDKELTAPSNHSAHEQMLEQLSDYEKNLLECVDNYRQRYQGDFYVIVLTKKERLFKNVFRHYFFTRLSCPTPEWDQVVYQYTYKTGDIEFLWVVPDKATCEFMTNNSLEIPPDEKQLLKYVLDFNDGTLLKIAKTLNGESEADPGIISIIC